MSNETPSRLDPYEAFVVELSRQEPRIRTYVRPLVRSLDDLDEVMQQTCVVLWRKYSEFEPGSDFLAWACTVARFEVLKFRRTRARDRHMFSEELIALLADEEAAEFSRRERERQALAKCIGQLPPQQRELIERCYGAGVSIKEVAESLGRSATSLYKALDRIRGLLLQCIERSLAEEAGA
jgi:RNA polymerase sigma-70 factor (ECF subfamily)